MTTSQQYRNIRSTMIRNGVTNEAIAEELEVTPNYVTRVITGRNVGHRVRKHIAKACGVSVTELWPDEPDEEGEPDLPKAA